MLPESVFQKLKSYREYSGRCAYLEIHIRELKREIDRDENRLYMDQVILTANLDGMPHGSNVGNPTERAGITLADGYEPDYLVKKKRELAEEEQELAEKSLTVIFVNAWLKGLTERERWIIENQVIDGVSWRELASEYFVKFGETRTKRSLQMLRDRTMDKIYTMAE